METVNLDFWVLIRQGAIATYPLLLCSVVVLGVTLERLWSLRGIIDSTKALAASVVPLLNAKKRQEAQTLLAGHDACPARRVFSELLEASHKSIEHLDRIADERQFEEMQGAMSYLWSLGTIAAAAPFIGLFGTVIASSGPFTRWRSPARVASSWWRPGSPRRSSPPRSAWASASRRS